MAAGVRLEAVHYRYPGGDWVLRGLDLDSHPGRYCVVFGASGSGKSTFARTLNGLVPHFFKGELRGRVRVNGMDTAEAGIDGLFGRVGLVLQNTDAQLFSSTVEDDIAFGLESLRLPARRIEARIREIAAALGIQALLQRAPETLSGGERRLAAIAAVMGIDPPLLVLDEPFSSLDWKSAARVRHLLAGIGRTGRSLIVIEQNGGRFLRDADRLAVLAAGCCLFSGNPADGMRVLEQQHLVPAYPRRPAASPPPGGRPLLSVRDLWSGPSGDPILKGVSFELRAGETAALVGENGAGKTTLAKHLNGLLRPARGDVWLDGASIRPVPAAELSGRVGLCFQNPDDQFFKPTVREELEVGVRLRGSAAGVRLDDICRVFRLAGLLERPPQQLSEGEKKRVAVAAVVAMGPAVLVLDEPTAGQDAEARETLAGLIADTAGEGAAVLVVTHDWEFARACTGRWILLHEGRVVADARPEEILGDARLVAQGVMAPFPGEAGTG